MIFDLIVAVQQRIPAKTSAAFFYPMRFPCYCGPGDRNESEKACRREWVRCFRLPKCHYFALWARGTARSGTVGIDLGAGWRAPGLVTNGCSAELHGETPLDYHVCEAIRFMMTAETATSHSASTPIAT